MGQVSSLSKKSKPILKALAQFLEDHPAILQVRIEGHTSSKGKESRNLRTSEKEASAVVARLIKYGVDASRLEAAGYGSARPIQSNRTRSGRAANRRISITILSQELEVAPAPVVPESSESSESPKKPDASDPWGTGESGEGAVPSESPEIEGGDSPWGDAPDEPKSEDKEKSEVEEKSKEAPKEAPKSDSPWGR